MSRNKPGKWVAGADVGFTLVEVLIVVAIVAILAAIAISHFGIYRIRGYVAEVNTDAKNAFTAAQAYLTDNPNATITSLDMLKTGGYQISVHVTTLGTWAMTTTGGNIEIKTTATGVAKNNALIHANSKVNQAR